MHNNVLAEELAKFSQPLEEWWELDGAFKTLHEINPLRLQFIASQMGMRTGFHGLRILDVGCGGGILSEAMALQGAQVTGIDLAEGALHAAREHSNALIQQQNLKLDYQLESVETHSVTHVAHYDVITCMEMLEHVPDPAAIIVACAQALKPGGHLFLSTLNRTPKAFLLAIIGAEYLLSLVPRGTHTYNQFIRPAELSRVVRQQGLHVQQLSGLHYDPLTHIHRLNNDVSVNYLLHAVKAS
ncbi:MAG: bifunctional 2-polyprenyl-6-hydroxyphenol methylase/3-demethylubiquinol 3-O-methyltransferase UbiG [Gammaproteobacteria bacterium]|nr:bifunctional 2-polyprenyl-6-hydroxyphenol methylase/3-demethylubiquinol 3-O-methyltransferase UbiG [Gammaproteobacteria bacterium]